MESRTVFRGTGQNLVSVTFMKRVPSILEDIEICFTSLSVLTLFIYFQLLPVVGITLFAVGLSSTYITYMLLKKSDYS